MNVSVSMSLCVSETRRRLGGGCGRSQKLLLIDKARIAHPMLPAKVQHTQSALAPRIDPSLPDGSVPTRSHSFLLSLLRREKASSS